MASQVFHNHQEISRHDIQAAIAKAVELRAIHAALLQGTSPADLRLPSSASPSVARPSNHFSAQDYPVFTPSYEEEPSPGYHNNLRWENRRLSGIWDASVAEREEGSEADRPDYENISLSSRKAPPFGSDSGEAQGWATQDPKFRENSCLNHHSLVPTSPRIEIVRSELKPVTTCNACRPATISREKADNESSNRNGKGSNDSMVAPVSGDSHSSLAAPVHSKSSSKGPIFSRLFPRATKKKPKAAPPNCEASPNCAEGSEEAVSHVSKDWGVLTLESLKRELHEANENRDAALVEVSQMRFSLGELQQRLASLEKYCDELKKSLRQSVQGGRESAAAAPKRVALELSQEAMVEGFLQMVSEARLSVRQFCKNLVGQIEESDEGPIEKLNLLLQPHNLTLTSKYSKGVLYHVEALVNQCLHQDFENCVFQRNGSAKILDPQQDRKVSFSSFVALRNLSWNEVLGKGTKYYSEELSRFCDQKMSCIISTLNWSRPWPEQLLQSFFVAAKCVWLLHLLAFSFQPPVSILRVEENRSFDPVYMEDVLMERQQRSSSRGPARVKIMIMPGFYVLDKVLRCRVLCRYKTVVA